MYQDGEWIPIGGITQLGDLLDVQAGHPGDGQVLSFSSNGNRWVPTTLQLVVVYNRTVRWLLTTTLFLLVLVV
ncbi:MAG: hypothetical protein CM15mV4_1310 [Caudoviricetes sp.]|nr:MAG: hypothetical protein CM15mV4_1310 [Caudoviricetes sp.]